MAELSTAATSWLLEWLENHSVPGEEWAADICDPDDLSEPGATVDWETFAALCDRLAEYSEDPPPSLPLLPSPAEIAREIAEEIFLSSAAPARSSDVPAEIFFVEESPALASELFPGLEVRADVAADGEVILFEIGLPDDAPECPTFFELIKGVLEAAPLLVDQDAADVAFELHPGGARYAMRIPSRMGNVIPMAGRIEAELDDEYDVAFDREFDSSFESDRDNDEQEDGPPDSFFDAQTYEAHEPAAKPSVTSTRGASARERHVDSPSIFGDAFAQSLAALGDERQIGDHLFSLLRSEFRSSAARVWFDADSTLTPPAGARLEFGDSDKPPSHSLRLSAAGKPLGRLDIWDSESLTEAELEQLDRIVPWYTLVLRAASIEQQASTDALPTAHLSAIIDGSTDLIALVSLTGDVISLNASGQQLLGIASTEEARTHAMYDLVHGDDQQAMTFDIIPGVHRTKHWTGELAFQKLNSADRVDTLAAIHLLEDARTGAPTAIAVICRDVSASKELELALLESKERYRMLAENPFDLIAEMDEHAKFIYASSTFESELGYPPETLLGTPGNLLVHSDDRQAVMDNFSQTVASLATSQISFRVQHRDGSFRSFETTLKAYRSARDKLVVNLISRDTTDRVESVAALRQTELKLLQSQKMEAIGRMAGGVAHDFNNLLTAITGYCDLLLEELPAQHPARADAEEILKASERAAGLTHQLLAFSRRQVLQPRVLDLNNLVADMDRMLRRLIGEGIELITLLGGGAWPIKADPSQLQQVLLNLVVNSRDAMPDGGRITIETSNQAIGETLLTEFGEVPPGDYLTLSVSDTGSGMTKELVEMIFEPFFTTKESGKGTGLGLSTVIGIVQQSGGFMDVQTSPGSGSSFTIYLPKTENVAMLPEREPGSDQFRGKETVLLVEDSEPVRRLVVRCLKSKGYTVLDVASGVDALRVCNRHEGEINLLLSDVILPKMDGFEVARRVIAIRPDIKIIYMSGFTDDALARHGVRSQDVALLEKPFTPSTLLRTVREYLDDGTCPVTPMRVDPSDDSRA